MNNSHFIIYTSDLHKKGKFMRISAIAQYNYFTAANNIKQHPAFAGSKTDMLSPEQIEEFNDLRVFNHHIYEYKKGIRNLILTTEKSKYRKTIEDKLQKNEIPYLINEHKNKELINVFFGDEPCINVISTFSPKLNKLNAEQDFILGVLLGYDKVAQCDRYLAIKSGKLKLGPTEE